MVKNMSFTIPGTFFLAAGESTGFVYYFGSMRPDGVYMGSEDRGTQWAMAHPQLDSSYSKDGLIAELGVSDFRKLTSYYYEDSYSGIGYYGYSFMITNSGIDTVFTVQGGGVV